MNTRRFRILSCVACLFPVDVAVSVSLLAAQAFAAFVMPLRAAKRAFPPMKSPETSRVTIQILTWDGRPLLEEFLPSVLAAAGDHDVVIVDNGSTDDSVAFLKTHFPKVQVVRLDQNYG